MSNLDHDNTASKDNEKEAFRRAEAATANGMASPEERMAPMLKHPPEHWVALGPFNGKRGLAEEGGDIVLYEGGAEAARREAPEILRRSWEWESGYGAAALFDEYCFCYGEGRVFSHVLATVGHTDEEQDFRIAVQPPERDTSLGGEIVAYEGRSREPLHGYWKSWPLDFLANLSGASEEFKRMVDVNLPLGDNKSDILVRHRLAILCCATVERYIESVGEEYSLEVEGLHNGFGGGGLPLDKRSAPALYGRQTDNVYAPHPQPTPPE